MDFLKRVKKVFLPAEPEMPQVLRRRIRVQAVDTSEVPAPTDAPSITTAPAPPQVMRHHTRAHADEPPPTPSSLGNTATIGEMQTQGMPESLANDDFITGWQFVATMQLRTPLRVLRWHNKIITDKRAPPRVVEAQWEGVWIPHVRTWRDMGIDIPQFEEWRASRLGGVSDDGSTYLRFLIAVREVVETQEPIEDRLDKLRALLAEPEWRDKVVGRIPDEQVVNSLFPRFVDTIPHTDLAIREGLRDLGFDTPARLASASDDSLLAIKGVGPARLRKIREHCDTVTANRDSDRIDTVKR